MDQVEKIIHDFQVDPYLLYDAIVTSTDDYIYVVDMAQDLALVTENMWEDFDLPGRLVPGLVPAWGALVHPKDRERFFDSIRRMMAGETDEHNIEYQVCNRKGEYLWLSCRGRLKRAPSGAPILFAGVVTNLGSKGKIDHTTGLFTQRECEKRFNRLLEQGGGKKCGILLLGLDNFTQINDLNDHIFGDTVLRQFAQSVQRYLPPEAEIFRFDGDEFAVLYQGAGEQDIWELYRKLHLYANRRQEVDGVSYFCTVSGGIALLGRDSDNYLDLIKYASSALDVSKDRGKNTCTAFTPEILRTRLRSLELSNQLQISVAAGMRGFQLYFQPLARAGDLTIDGAEALLRWSGEGFGEVSPVEFIPILESSGLILTVGSWILDQACRRCAEWLEFCPDLVVNINISYLQMVEADFLNQVRGVLKRYGLEGRHVVLELTESYFVTDMEVLKDTFRSLREMGVRIAMDDFGTGYSSLGMLAQSPADVVKIDRAFIAAINANDFNRSFIGAVIQLCHSVGIKVCVEGVEDAGELDTVRSLCADSIQGFYISRPVPASEFEARYWVRKC